LPEYQIYKTKSGTDVSIFGVFFYVSSNFEKARIFYIETARIIIFNLDWDRGNIWTEVKNNYASIFVFPLKKIVLNCTNEYENLKKTIPTL
jgi:hypothetical protein